MEEFIQQAFDFLTTQGLTFAINLVVAILILIVGFWIAGRVSRAVKKLLGKAKKVDDIVADFLGSLVRYLLIAVTVIAVLERFGVETTSVVALLGAAGLAVGLALQGTLSNLAAGVMLLIFRPFKAGQYVDAGGIAGTVQTITLFTTEMDTPDNVRITVPNSQIWGQSIQNFSYNETRRLDIGCGIGYGDDIDKAQQVMLDVAGKDDRVLADPAAVTFVDTLGDSSVNLTLRFWCKAADYWQLKWDMTKAVKQGFDAAGVEIPFPQRVVTMVREDGPVTD